MPEPFYITTPIYYVNARPHLGHAYTTIVADVATRFHAMRDRETFFLTGTDEHGDKVVQAALKEGMSPRSYVDHISALFKNLWPEMNVVPNRFIRTTEPGHMRVVEHILQKIYDNGDIYYSEYEGLYCFGCERFYTERELVDGQCPDHRAVPERIRESNYFFKMSRYQDWLIGHINTHPDFIRPVRYRNEVLAFLREPLEDLCISRPKSRLKWGITLPFDDQFVTYVWFDALLNYVSALGYPDGAAFAKFWPAAQHIVAKDILKPHGIYWPIMLKAAGIPLFRHLNVHGYWNVDEGKMSKSIGNVVDALEMKNIYGLDAFRFFLMREMVFGLDSNFSEEALVSRINSDLANDLGNLFSRVIAMTQKYFGGVVPAPDPDVDAEFDFGLAGAAAHTAAQYEAAMSGFQFYRALQSVWEFINKMNKTIDVAAPWELAKSASRRKQLESVMIQLLEGLRVVAGLIYPVMPDTAKTMQTHLGQDADAPFWRLETLRRWNTIAPGTRIPRSIKLFPRIDDKKKIQSLPAAGGEAAAPPDIKAPIDMETLSRIDLRVGTIRRAAPVPRAKRLLQLEVDIGEPRTVVAGLAGSYRPEELEGRQVILVANLKPAKLMGVVSNGMLLAAVDGDATALATVDRRMPPGTPLR
jgi:methionyl-tRNA synthetase